MIQFAAVIALGLFTAWLARSWIEFYGDLYSAAVIWIGACILFAVIYDWRRARSHRSTDENR
jgi:hypothetical protein